MEQWDCGLQKIMTPKIIIIPIYLDNIRFRTSLAESATTSRAGGR